MALQLSCFIILRSNGDVFHRIISWQNGICQTVMQKKQKLCIRLLLHNPMADRELKISEHSSCLKKKMLTSLQSHHTATPSAPSAPPRPSLQGPSGMPKFIDDAYSIKKDLDYLINFFSTSANSFTSLTEIRDFYSIVSVYATVMYNAPVICIPGSPGAGDSGDIAGLKCQALTYDASRQCRGFAGVMISRQYTVTLIQIRY